MTAGEIQSSLFTVANKVNVRRAYGFNISAGRYHPVPHLSNLAIYLRISWKLSTATTNVVAAHCTAAAKDTALHDPWYEVNATASIAAT